MDPSSSSHIYCTKVQQIADVLTQAPFDLTHTPTLVHLLFIFFGFRIKDKPST